MQGCSTATASHRPASLHSSASARVRVSNAMRTVLFDRAAVAGAAGGSLPDTFGTFQQGKVPPIRRCPVGPLTHMVALSGMLRCNQDAAVARLLLEAAGDAVQTAWRSELRQVHSRSTCHSGASEPYNAKGCLCISTGCSG